MINISKRLLSLEKYIFPEDKVMDVGCDHAILDIHLVQIGKLSRIYVGDVNPNALENGKENIEKYELSSNVFPVLSYGIEKINELEVDTLIISGMGARTIVEILSSPNLDRIFKVVLQPNNNYGELREFLASKNFKIVDEEIIEDAKKTYVNIVALRNNEEVKYSKKEIEFGPILITQYDNLEYFKKLHVTYENIYYASHSDESKEKMQILEEIIASLE